MPFFSFCPCGQVLKRDPDTDSWKMDTIDENKPRGLAPPFFQRILKTAWFHITILILVLANAIITATIHFDHYKIDPYQKIDGYYYAEVSWVANGTSRWEPNF